MPETPLERHYRDRVQSVRQMALRDGDRAALPARDFGELALLCYELAVSGRQLLEYEYRHIFHEPDVTVSWLQERRRILEELSADFQGLVESVRAVAHEARQAVGPPGAVEILGRLDEAIRAAAETKQRVLEQWPVGSDDEIHEAQAAAARGEGLDLDEAFAQIAGVDVETWRRRVEAYTEPSQR